ncbi:MAG: hypothetical protein L0312_11365 [Acidobacteria bacterium]|nr:hypothetical protein [Acidobacteriota bacterium]
MPSLWPIWWLIIDASSFSCEYYISQKAYSPHPFSTEHIVPKVLRAVVAEDNLARACQGCTNLKRIAAAIRNEQQSG